MKSTTFLFLAFAAVPVASLGLPLIGVSLAASVSIGATISLGSALLSEILQRPAMQSDDRLMAQASLAESAFFAQRERMPTGVKRANNRRRQTQMV